MRVKLSYTVDVEDVLKEGAKILNLQAEVLQHGIDLFTAIQNELRGNEETDGPPNVGKALEMIEEFRKALLSVDTRLEEITQIVHGYEEYQRGERDGTTLLLEEDELSEVVDALD